MLPRKEQRKITSPSRLGSEYSMPEIEIMPEFDLKILQVAPGIVDAGAGDLGNAAGAAPGEAREFAFNELIGLEGPLLTLFENAATVILTIG